MDYSKMSDSELIILCRKEDEKAKEALFKKYQNYIYKWSHSLNHNTTLEVEDIIQEYTILFLISIQKVRLAHLKSSSNNSFLIYLSYIFKSYKKVIRRKYQYESMGLRYKASLDDEYFSYENTPFILEDHTDNIFIEDFKKILTPYEFKIISSFYKEGEKKGEIAKKLKISPSMMTYKHKKILEKLNDALYPEKDLLLSY